MKPMDVVFLDRDGTLIEDTGYISSTKNLKPFPDVFDGLKILCDAGFKLVVVSNQSGVGRGIITMREFEEVSKEFILIFQRKDIHFEAIYYCTHAPWESCICRKPSRFFFDQFRSLVPRLNRAVVIGDSLVDKGFAHNSNLPFISRVSLNSYRSFIEIAEEVIRVYC